MNTEDRCRTIELRLIQTLQPTQLQVTDDSAQHIGHPGAKQGGGHYSVAVVSPLFADKSLVDRHRLVYDALGDMLKSEIHALRIDAKTPEENNH